MNWVESLAELVNAATPVLLVIAGIAGTAWGVIYQTRNAAEAEARAQVLGASATLVAVAQQIFVYTDMLAYSKSKYGRIPDLTLSIDKTLNQAHSSVGILYMYGGDLSQSASTLLGHLIACTTAIELNGSDPEVPSKLFLAIEDFATEARKANTAGFKTKRRVRPRRETA